MYFVLTIGVKIKICLEMSVATIIIAIILNSNRQTQRTVWHDTVLLKPHVIKRNIFELRHKKLGS